VNTIDVHAEAARRLAVAGQHLTTGRRAVLDALMTARAPVSVVDLAGTEPGLALSSVYRNIHVLEAAGVVARLPGPGGDYRVELAEPLASHHHHLVCRVCGRLEDCILEPLAEESLDRAARAAARQHDFTVDQHRIDLIGLCARCRSVS
jgi:Fur family transcriptional regulator, ferric uptake regulator